MVVTGNEIRRRRASAGITGDVLCQKAAISRTRLSNIERGYIQPSQAELLRISQALEALLAAKERLMEVAEELGWPPNAL